MRMNTRRRVIGSREWFFIASYQARLLNSPATVVYLPAEWLDASLRRRFVTRRIRPVPLAGRRAPEKRKRIAEGVIMVLDLDN